VFLVPPRKAPIIVRTEPKKNKRDVAINQLIQVVFSEPIAAGSLTRENFDLRSGSTQVAGQLRFADSVHTIVELRVPSSTPRPTTGNPLGRPMGGSSRSSSACVGRSSNATPKARSRS
jgi:hypothetical protein